MVIALPIRRINGEGIITNNIISSKDDNSKDDKKKGFIANFPAHEFPEDSGIKQCPNCGVCHDSESKVCPSCKYQHNS